MVYSIILIFILLCLLAYIDERLPHKYKMAIFILFGMILVIIAGSREIGIDPDSENYASTYLNYYNEQTERSVEFSYILIASILNKFSSDVHLLFFFYAFIGLGLKFIAFRKYTEFYFLPIIVYISYFYDLQELMQIRTGILSGCLLLSIKPWSEGKRWLAFIYMLIGTFFHTSGLILFPLLFLTNKGFEGKRKYIWGAIIPISYLFYLCFSGFLIIIDLPYIGNKLAIYQAATELGVSHTTNLFSPLHLFTIFLFYYMLFFSKTITNHNKYFPLMLKIFCLGICSYVIFSFIPIMAERISFLLRTCSIILYVGIYYTIKPKWLGILVVEIISLIYLNYGLTLFDFTLLWEMSVK